LRIPIARKRIKLCQKKNEDISFDDSQLSEEEFMDDVEDDSNKHEDNWHISKDVQVWKGCMS
jgi:hypothetical protein